ncbi:MAG: polysaccharide pyruvyl transferase family protein [Muribaculum sp.]|nr:polysaccharide pyruvyl transferase family protein [Muribaculum sp.]
MKVLIVTMHRGNNLGSALQAYALSEKIKTLGGEPIILDYIPDRINFKKLLKISLNQLFGINGLKIKYNSMRSLAILVSSQLKYNRFFRRELNLTHRYTSLQQLEQELPYADVYMTGSDQVWNSFHNQGLEKVFYLSFVPDGKRKVAYSASFGRTHLEDWEVDETRRLLSRYKNISVREQSGIDVLNSIGLSGKCVLDPTFLLDKDEWIKRTIPHNESDQYVLIYSVEPDKSSLIKIAREIADKIGAKVFMVEWGKKPFKGVDKMISLPDPLTLIDYFAKAEFVVASSFHGTALSINLNRQFISVAPAKFSTRVQSILTIVGEDERLVNPDNYEINKALIPIDYENINNRLNIEREKSITILKAMIE